MTAPTGTDERALPPLPKPDLWRKDDGFQGYTAMPEAGPWFDGDSMRAYVLADRASLGAAQVPAGWKLVPLVPTTAMALAALHLNLNGELAINGVPQYIAMLAAAPEPTAGAAQVPTEHQIERHTHAAKDCPPDSKVLLVSSVKRLQARAARNTSAGAAQVPSLSNAQIDALLNDLDDVARKACHYDYGLPVHEPYGEKLRSIVRDALSQPSQPSQQGTKS